MRFSWIRAGGMAWLFAAAVTLQGAPAATAQFVPYGGSPNQGYNQYQAHTAPQAPPHYTAMAYQGSDTRSAMPSLNQSVEAIQPGPTASGGQAMQAAPAQSYSAAPAAGCNCQATATPSYSPSAPAATSFESYPATGGWGSGSCGAYNTFTGGGCGVGAPYGACNSCCDTGCNTGCDPCCRPRCRCRCFGGVYGLYMQRVANDWVPLAFSTPTGNVPPYYPADTEYVGNLGGLTDTDHYGAEIRLGMAFGGRGRGGCGDCSCDCGPRCAWEVAYWGLAEEDASFQVTDTAVDADRLYSMIDFRGVQLDMGPGFRPMNHYFDYGPPTSDYTNGGALDEIQVRSLNARSNFSMQNIEFNLLRLPVLSGGCNTCCASSCCGCGTGGGCGIGRRGGFGYAGPRYTVTTLVGARYMRIDDDFFFRSDWENMNTAATGFAAYTAEADNHLVGLHLGCNGIYRIGCSCRWAIHCSANAGIYGNHSEVQEFVDVPTGGSAEYITGGTFRVDSSDDTVATIAELRFGGSYQCTCNWRLYGGYRATGIAGVALAFDQIASAQVTQPQASYIDSNGSIFLHGIQAGVECTY